MGVSRIVILEDVIYWLIMSNRSYTQELEQLHYHLKDIMTQIDRVCDQLGIRYFVDGGTAMGAYYESDILAWDDIDLAMERDQYERFE